MPTCAPGTARKALSADLLAAGWRIGPLGLGRIGQAIAERITAMKLEVAYCTRRPRDLPTCPLAH
ncbi:hypothetical protein CLG85_010965 [Yangia mangrovi]|uniref:D-isomer specific 2-hydroxyacid dehydrogenase NAD-binding domain-containing protein n=1 Tax=Alloyangia mangrovi TaxID=1779329 RepID=A0ABT2KKC7_9RHOB|nr:hypothetical protein [Alloyangia mangrovi]